MKIPRQRKDTEHERKTGEKGRKERARHSATISENAKKENEKEHNP